MDLLVNVMDASWLEMLVNILVQFFFTPYGPKLFREIGAFSSGRGTRLHVYL